MADRIIGIRAGAVAFDRPSEAVDQGLLQTLYDQPLRRTS